MEADRKECHRLTMIACGMDHGAYQRATKVLFAVRRGDIEPDEGKLMLKGIVREEPCRP